MNECVSDPEHTEEISPNFLTEEASMAYRRPSRPQDRWQADVGSPEDKPLYSPEKD